jgi:hypothetical protein
LADVAPSQSALEKFAHLTPNEQLRDTQFVSFILYDLLRRCAHRLFVSILRQFAMTPDYLFAAFDPYYPIRFVSIP